MDYAKSFHDDVEINMTSDSYKQNQESPNQSNSDNQVLHEINRLQINSLIEYIMIFESFESYLAKL